MERRSFLKVIGAAIGSLFIGIRAKAREPKVCEFKAVPGVNPNDWYDPRNWATTGGHVPQAGDTVVINHGAVCWESARMHTDFEGNIITEVSNDGEHWTRVNNLTEMKILPGFTVPAEHRHQLDGQVVPWSNV